MIQLTPVALAENSKSEPSVIGNRVKSARMLAGYSRCKFAEKSRISAATLRIWEEPPPNRGGITKKGVARLITTLQSCGIYCTMEWIWTGKGQGPAVINFDKGLITNEVEAVTWGEEEAIFKDIESFKANNSNPIVAVVSDGSMLPFYSYGDYVGGSKKQDGDIASLVGSNCIIELEDMTIIRRISRLDNVTMAFTLSALNVDSSISEPIMQTNKIISAAKIIWHRGRERAKNIIV